mmetsp:Transcript_10556/g.64882  ORF Transcript_10556/g.64882 Transcript_10556/m.64882 type:complete len:370 (-) Transcript_10556:1598-2707(-)
MVHSNRPACLRCIASRSPRKASSSTVDAEYTKWLLQTSAGPFVRDHVSRSIASSGVKPIPPATYSLGRVHSSSRTTNSPPTRTYTSSPTPAASCNHRVGSVRPRLTATSKVPSTCSCFGEVQMEYPPTRSTLGACKSIHCPARKTKEASRGRRTKRFTVGVSCTTCTNVASVAWTAWLANVRILVADATHARARQIGIRAWKEAERRGGRAAVVSSATRPLRPTSPAHLPWPRIDASARAPPCRGPQVSKRQAWRTKASRIPRAPPAPAPTTSARFGRTWTFHRGAGTMEVPSTWTWNEDGPPPTWHRGRMDTMWKTGPTHQPTDPRHGGSKHETRPNVPCSIPKTRGAARHRGIVRPSNGAGTRPPHS